MSDPIGFIGLGNMGFPMMSRLLAAGHPVVVFDVREDVRTEATALGARAAESVRAVADQAETVLASLPTPQVSEAVVADIAAGSAIRRFIDLSTVEAKPHNVITRFSMQKASPHWTVRSAEGCTVPRQARSQ